MKLLTTLSIWQNFPFGLLLNLEFLASPTSFYLIVFCAIICWPVATTFCQPISDHSWLHSSHLTNSLTLRMTNNFSNMLVRWLKEIFKQFENLGKYFSASFEKVFFSFQNSCADHQYHCVYAQVLQLLRVLNPYWNEEMQIFIRVAYHVLVL